MDGELLEKVPLFHDKTCSVKDGSIQQKNSILQRSHSLGKRTHQVADMRVRQTLLRKS